jgi:hypothetical protein
VTSGMRRGRHVWRTPMWRHAPNDYEYTNKLRGVASHGLFGFLVLPHLRDRSTNSAAPPTRDSRKTRKARQRENLLLRSMRRRFMLRGLWAQRSMVYRHARVDYSAER